MDYFLTRFLCSAVHFRKLDILSVTEFSLCMTLSLFILANKALISGMFSFLTGATELISELDELIESLLFSLNKVGDLGSFLVISTESASLVAS